MAIVVVTGDITRMKDYPKTEEREAQVNLTVTDGERYSMYVPADSALAALELGDRVEVVGKLRVKGRYLNVDEPVLKRVAETTWHVPGAGA